MKKHLLLLIIAIIPMFAFADLYPINKSIDIRHYTFKLVLSDSTDEIVGNAQITLQFKKAGIQLFNHPVLVVVWKLRRPFFMERI